jgi:hypothetical protein
MFFMKFVQLTIDGSVGAKFGPNKPPGCIIWYELEVSPMDSPSPADRGTSSMSHLMVQF